VLHSRSHLILHSFPTRRSSDLTDRQNLIVAQTVQLTDEQALKNAITRNPLDPKIVSVEIIPTDKPTAPGQTEAPSFEEALREARSEEHTSELQSRSDLVCRLLL